MITEEQVVEIVKHECEKRKWPFKEPLHIEKHLIPRRVWHVMTNASVKGGHVFMDIHGKTGEILDAKYGPR